MIPVGVLPNQEQAMNAVSEVVMPEPLVFTENAAAKVRQLIDDCASHG